MEWLWFIPPVLLGVVALGCFDSANSSRSPVVWVIAAVILSLGSAGGCTYALAKVPQEVDGDRS